MFLKFLFHHYLLQRRPSSLFTKLERVSFYIEYKFGLICGVLFARGKYILPSAGVRQPCAIMTSYPPDGSVRLYTWGQLI